MIEAFPLCWPIGFPRAAQQIDSKFKTTMAAARDFVKAEVKRLKATDLIISTDIPVNKNGELTSARISVDDTGVAIYFMRNGEQVSLCCDTYKRVHENLYAIGRTIDSLRRIDRDGTSDFLNRAFRGFTAIEAPKGRDCWTVLGIPQTPNKIAIRTAWVNKVKDYSAADMEIQELNIAKDEANRYADSVIK